MYQLNRRVQSVCAPPIADAQSWIRGRTFPSEQPLLDVAQAVPSYPPAQALTAHLARRLAEPETALYTDILGLPALREALAAHMSAEYGGRIAPGEVAVTAGCNQAFCVAVNALAAPGDEVILPLPYYFNHQMWLEAHGVRAVHLPFHEAAGAVPDPAEAAERITPRTRAIVLVTPNNPTGREYPAEAIEAFYHLARRHDLALIVDETYKDFRAGEGPPHRLFQHDDWPEGFIQLYSFSKAYGLTGYRVGAMIGARSLLNEAAKILDCVAICPPQPGQLAALYALTALGGWRRERCAHMRERLRLFVAGVERARLPYELVSAGAYFAYLRHPFGRRESGEVARRLAREAAILCLPGSMFGPAQEPYLRFAFANLEADQIPELLARLSRFQG